MTDKALNAQRSEYTHSSGTLPTGRSWVTTSLASQKGNIRNVDTQQRTHSSALALQLPQCKDRSSSVCSPCSHPQLLLLSSPSSMHGLRPQHKYWQIVICPTMHTRLSNNRNHTHNSHTSAHYEPVRLSNSTNLGSFWKNMFLVGLYTASFGPKSN